MEDFDISIFLALKNIYFLKNKVSLNDYFFLILQPFSQGVSYKAGLFIRLEEFSLIPLT